MKSLEEIQACFSVGLIDVTVHAAKRMLIRNVLREEIQEAGASAVEVEDYPNDKYYASCLLLGFTSAVRPLHLHVSRVPTEGVRLITLYEPDESEWEPGFMNRRKTDV